jgi:hypothetical protein
MAARVIDFDREGGDYTLCQFGAMCSIARSIQPSLEDLMNATVDSVPGWVQILDGLNTHIVDRFEDDVGQELNIGHYLEWARKEIDDYARTHSSRNRALSQVLSQIGQRVQEFGPGGLKLYFAGVEARGRDLARECVQAWGGPRAKRYIHSRLTELIDLSFVYESADRAFDMYFDDEDRVIVVPVGMERGILRRCLNLEFYFFHEYLSHIFPRYDDERGVFSEGYLFAIERDFYESTCGSHVPGTLLRSDLEQNRLLASRPSIARFYEEVREKTAWLMLQCNHDLGRIPSLLLDLAVTSADDVSKSFHDIFLGRLRNADQDFVRKIICPGGDGLSELAAKLPTNFPAPNNLWVKK